MLYILLSDTTSEVTAQTANETRCTLQDASDISTTGPGECTCHCEAENGKWS
jgi:hypothetical protein